MCNTNTLLLPFNHKLRNYWVDKTAICSSIFCVCICAIRLHMYWTHLNTLYKHWKLINDCWVDWNTDVLTRPDPNTLHILCWTTCNLKQKASQRENKKGESKNEGMRRMTLVWLRTECQGSGEMKKSTQVFVQKNNNKKTNSACPHYQLSNVIAVKLTQTVSSTWLVRAVTTRLLQWTVW